MKNRVTAHGRPDRRHPRLLARRPNRHSSHSPVDLDLNALVNQMCCKCSRRRRRSPCDVEGERCPRSSRSTGRGMQQVLQNLISNAIRASRQARSAMIRI
jgi:signal transduction histidine kinase